MCQSQRRTHRHSIFCILPPDMVSAIARNGTPEQRTLALQALNLDQTIRTMRVSRALMATTQPRSPALFLTEGHPQRTIRDARHNDDIVRTEGAGSTGDPAVDEAYDGLGATYNFYWSAYQRNSIDDGGMPLNATVHFGDRYANAFWDGERMVFGDGDNDLFNRFTISIDVIGHELTHGVTADEANLIYEGQSGALNESISDVFGSLVKQFALNQTADQADWLIGAGLFTAKVHGVALRSMKAPGTAFDDPVLGKDRQPATMQNYDNRFADHHGVHINSGIPNHAFYLAATRLGGYAWEKAGRIWYETLRDSRLRSSASFQSFAQLTVANAIRLYSHGGTEWQVVRDAWGEVGITVS